MEHYLDRNVTEWPNPEFPFLTIEVTGTDRRSRGATLAATSRRIRRVYGWDLDQLWLNRSDTPSFGGSTTARYRVSA